MRRFLILLVLTVLVGCQHTFYDWGSYETSIKHLYSDAPEAKIAQDRKDLTDEIRSTIKHERKVPPGKYAHLGYLCYLQGDTAAAKECFVAEKKSFPASSKLMDDMIARLP